MHKLFTTDTIHNKYFSHFYHVRCEDERSAITLEGAKHLGVPEELSKVDVEEVAAVLHHYVVVVPVADAQDVRDDAVARAGTWKKVRIIPRYLNFRALAAC